MTYCSKCGQSLPAPRFRIINGPARLLFLWPLVDFVFYFLHPSMSPSPGYGRAAELAFGVVLTAAMYAWIALSGR
jgi:hypothetical protein